MLYAALGTGVKHIPHSPESKEELNKCYVEVLAIGYVNGTSLGGDGDGRGWRRALQVEGKA